MIIVYLGAVIICGCLALSFIMRGKWLPGWFVVVGWVGGVVTGCIVGAGIATNGDIRDAYLERQYQNHPHEIGPRERFYLDHVWSAYHCQTCGDILWRPTPKPVRESGRVGRLVDPHIPKFHPIYDEDGKIIPVR